MKTLKKIPKQVASFGRRKKTVKTGSGYTQPKRNTYKINNKGEYGNLMIDIPKLMGHLHLIAKNGDQFVIN